MKKNLHNSIQVPVTFKNVFKAVIYRIVFFIIKNGWFQNAGKFKKGDTVKYNWKAKYYIGSVFEDKHDVLTITEIIKYSDGTEGCEYVNANQEESGCDVFWLCKA